MPSKTGQRAELARLYTIPYIYHIYTKHYTLYTILYTLETAGHRTLHIVLYRTLLSDEYTSEHASEVDLSVCVLRVGLHYIANAALSMQAGPCNLVFRAVAVLHTLTSCLLASLLCSQPLPQGC